METPVQESTMPRKLKETVTYGAQQQGKILFFFILQCFMSTVGSLPPFPLSLSEQACLRSHCICFSFTEHCFGLSEGLQQVSKSARLGKYFDNAVCLILSERKNKEDCHFSPNFTGALNQNATENQIAD